MPSTYILAQIEITDPQKYEQYRKLSGVAMQEYGGELCVRGSNVPEVLEGDWTPGRLVLLKFPSLDKARAWYDSPEYVTARKAREGAAIMRIVLIEGM